MTDPKHRIAEMKATLRGAGIDVSRLAKGANVAVSTVWRWEKSKSCPRFHDMARLETSFSDLMASASDNAVDAGANS